MNNSNNKRVRKAMFEANLKQYHLAELLGVTESRVSAMLRYEMPEDKQKEIVALIKGQSNEGAN